jgi:hypothetical protein
LFQNTSKAAETVGGKAVKIPLINSGMVSGVNPDAELARNLLD